MLHCHLLGSANIYSPGKFRSGMGSQHSPFVPPSSLVQAPPTGKHQRGCLGLSRHIFIGSFPFSRLRTHPVGCLGLSHVTEGLLAQGRRGILAELAQANFPQGRLCWIGLRAEQKAARIGQEMQVCLGNRIVTIVAQIKRAVQRMVTHINHVYERKQMTWCEVNLFDFSKKM